MALATTLTVRILFTKNTTGEQQRTQYNSERRIYDPPPSLLFADPISQRPPDGHGVSVRYHEWRMLHSCHLFYLKRTNAYVS
jgi:hypothetical protein